MTTSVEILTLNLITAAKYYAIILNLHNGNTDPKKSEYLKRTYQVVKQHLQNAALTLGNRLYDTSLTKEALLLDVESYVKEIIFEFMLNNLRLKEGFLKKDFMLRTSFNLDCIIDTLNIAVAKNLLEITTDRIKPTTLGRRFLNDLQELFILNTN